MSRAELVTYILDRTRGPYTPGTAPYERLRAGLARLSMENLRMLRLGILNYGHTRAAGGDS